jgi:hypothetical protein
MRTSKVGRPLQTSSTCPVCESGPREFCREVISEAGAATVRLNGYILDVHPERMGHAGRLGEIVPRQLHAD